MAAAFSAAPVEGNPGGGAVDPFDGSPEGAPGGGGIHPGGGGGNDDMTIDCESD